MHNEVADIGTWKDLQGRKIVKEFTGSVLWTRPHGVGLRIPT